MIQFWHEYENGSKDNPNIRIQSNFRTTYTWDIISLIWNPEKPTWKFHQTQHVTKHVNENNERLLNVDFERLNSHAKRGQTTSKI